MIEYLKLENFRNHKKFSLVLDKTTVLIGNNGVGKTNILESITLVSFGKSFREEDRKNLIMDGKDWSRVTLDDHEIFLQRHPRLLTKIKSRGVPRKMSQVIGDIPAIVFSPETLQIINGDPGIRRKFLDIMISQIDKGYLKALSNYTKVRRRRNKLLEMIHEGRAREIELAFWDREISALAKSIVSARKTATEQIGQEIGAYYKTIAGESRQRLNLEYKASVKRDFEKALIDNRSRDIARKTTILGPHRDDLQFKIESLDMAHFASRGEVRSAILSLKLAELEFIKRTRSTRPNIYPEEAEPVLLLDDVYSEFDEKRRDHLAELVENHQSLITATEKDHISKKLIKTASVVEVLKNDNLK